MNALRMQIWRQQAGFLKFYYNILNLHRLLPVTSFATTVDLIDGFTNNKLIQHKENKNTNVNMLKFSIQNFNDTDKKVLEVTSLSEDELEKAVQELLLKNKDRQIEQILLQCLSIRKLLSDPLLKTLFKHYSGVGKPDMVIVLQKYFSRLLPDSYRRNGEFTHYMAKAQCLKGNSEKGLALLKECYQKNENLRSFYRAIFKDLIHDSVLNRSEASLVVFRKYVLEFSQSWEEHYPLVCFWHICWLSTWYSDQILSDDLWDSSQDLQDIVKEKVAALSISALRLHCNEDAVVRLLQTLLKYQMMEEYTSVLQVLFSYKLRNKDARGCAEIVRNCEVLGISLTSEQQGRYIKMLIHGQPPDKPAEKHIKPTKAFKLKF